MAFYKFIRMKGCDAKNTGFYAPRLYRFDFSLNALKIFGFSYIKDRINGWYYWWVEDEADLKRAIDALDELKKYRIFSYEVIK